MNTFWCSICCLTLLNIFILLVGYSLMKMKLVLLSWMLAVLGTLIAYVIFQSATPVWKMLGPITTLFVGMKAVVATVSYKGRTRSLNFIQWVCFACFWVGMRPQLFETLGGKSIVGGWRMIGFGLSRIVLGFLLIQLSRVLYVHYSNSSIVFSIYIIALLMGLSLILHFGILNISAGLWRFVGVQTGYLFKSPANSSSVTEFWGKRWNIAFSEMTSIAMFRPLVPVLGKGTALMCAFLFSGLLHELALSVPVNVGYGLPLLYFLIQGCAVWIENKRKISGRLWTAA